MEQNIINIERELLAHILFCPDDFDEISNLLSENDFLHPAHKNFFNVLIELKAQNLPITNDFVKARLTGKRKIAEEDFIAILQANTIANIKGFISEIKEQATRRALKNLASSLHQQTLDMTKTSYDIAQDAEREIYSISRDGAQNEFKNAATIALEVTEKINKIKENNNLYITGLNTGFNELNQKTTGFNPGDLIVIGARPSMGKTALILNIVHTILSQRNKDGNPCGAAIFSLEMNASDLMLRMLSFITDIPLHDIRTGKLNDTNLEKFNEAVNEISKKPLYVDDGSMLSITQLSSKLRSLVSKDPSISIAVIDYLQLMSSTSKRAESARQEEISEISRGLKNLARELEIPIIALSQLNRGVESRDDKRPILSDLRESGAIEQDADMIIFIYRDNVYRMRALREKASKLKKDNKEKEAKQVEEDINNLKKETKVEDAELILAKNRNGEIGTIDILYHAPFTKFADKVRHSDEKYENMAETKFDDNVEVYTMKI